MKCFTKQYYDITIFCSYHHKGITATYEWPATDVDVIHEDFEMK